MTRLFAAVLIIAAPYVLRYILRMLSTPERLPVFEDDAPEIVDDPWLAMVREWWERAA